MPDVKNASFAAIEIPGQKTTENMTAKTKNMIAVNKGPRRRMLTNSFQIIWYLPIVLIMNSLHGQAIPARSTPCGTLDYIDEHNNVASPVK